jgi:putative hydrolase of the HAD superfamily
LAVISNADGKIEALLQRNGIADCFESMIDSGIVGCEKPAPRIFRVALEAMEVSASESLYVGDVHSVDYIGATRAGMQAILFDVAGAYRENGAPRVASLEELELSLLGA